MSKEKALLAAGCFWGVQDYIDQIPGVTKTTVGYSGGHQNDPTYEEVCSSSTGHAESILVEFDPKQVTYETILKHFFRLHDPTQYMRQGPDIGPQYRSAIFYFDKDQKNAANKVINYIQSEHDGKIMTEVSPATDFYAAEEYHQKFVEKTGRGSCHVPYQSID